jgi:hypothetical protein
MIKDREDVDPEVQKKAEDALERAKRKRLDFRGIKRV